MQAQPRGAAAGLRTCKALICCSAHSTTNKQPCRSETRPTKVTKVKKHTKQREHPSPQPGPGALLWASGSFLLQERGKGAGRRGSGAVGLSPGLAAVPVSPHGAGVWGWSCCWSMRSPLRKIQHRPFPGSLCSGAASKQGTALINVTFMLKTSREAVI